MKFKFDLQLFATGWYPKNPLLDQEIQSDVDGETPDEGHIAHLQWSAAEAATASTTRVHAAVTDTGAAQTVTTGITNPPCPRNITATAGGTAEDIKAIQVIVAGTDFNDEAISETLPVFTENTAGSVVGSKAFKTVTSITIPAHDGTGATTAIGYGDKLGLPYLLTHNTLLMTFLNNVLEGTAATIASSSTLISSNTIDLHSALNGTVVDAYFIV
jgi:hypothetical protein